MVLKYITNQIVFLRGHLPLESLSPVALAAASSALDTIEMICLLWGSDHSKPRVWDFSYLVHSSFAFKLIDFEQNFIPTDSNKFCNKLTDRVIRGGMVANL